MNPTALLAKNPDLHSLNPPHIVENPQTSGIHKILEDEINSFLAAHK
jgi:hypothetical protein